jgi:ferredoxin-NADP reductase/predicted pyridoxine 5'-phosphate oxidase superfamily flavin-nucleotide-binding protein
MSAQVEASAWHAGELAMQQHAGVVEKMREVGRRVVRSSMPEQHRTFFAQLPFVVLGTVDDNGDAWATVRAGLPGFTYSPDPRTLQLRVASEPDDPAARGIGEAKPVALLGIDLSTRRRNRMNGTVRRANADGFAIGVEQSFGNCPQYIQKRAPSFTRDPGSPSDFGASETATIDERARAIVAQADTFFVASYAERDDGRQQVDVSHRGGRPGFVRLDADGGLTIPDFAGNLFFNTLGNILLNGKAGLVFPDFSTGDLLQMSGDAEVILDSPDIAAFQGAERVWRFMPRRVVYRRQALPLVWTRERNHAGELRDEGASPNALMTGTWDEAAGRLAAIAHADTWRAMRIAKIVDESAAIRSFHLEPADHAGLIAHRAGQHLPIRVTLPGATTPVIRTYTLSVAPSDGVYRISVKREGAVSRHLHDTLKVGDLVETRAPAGSFVIDALETRPAVLLAAGIGITPILAMLKDVVYEGLRKRRIRPTWLFYSAHSLKERAFDTELRQLVTRAQGSVQLVRTLTDAEDAEHGRDREATGRIDMDLLRAKLPFDDYDFYLCGPSAFMQAMYDGLRALNVADARIHAESFGPSALKRDNDRSHAAKAADNSVPVAFVISGKEANWTPGSGTLLELAERQGLKPEFGCRGGTCGTCRTKIVKGEVAYPNGPSFDVAADEALICCAVPAAEASTLQLEM